MVVELMENGEGVVKILALRSENLLPARGVDGQHALRASLDHADAELGSFDPVVLA
jgi:hypothetical protein